jgi:transposase
MFPRISKSQKNNKTYQYLVISESIRKNGKSTTRNIANLGNIERFSKQNIESLLDGLIKIFKIDQYVLRHDVEILESLEHGSIIFWRTLWRELNLSRLIGQQLKKRKYPLQLAVNKYVEMMVVNRCIRPCSKLGMLRWLETTSYKAMQGYSELWGCDDEDAVNYFYRSMDYLVEMKDDLELAIFEHLRNLFSINVKLTFYDITSSFFYTQNCSLGEQGYSRDHRPDCEQIVIGVVTSYEGYPIKHYVFDGNTTDGTTVKGVLKDLKESYHIEETVFVGDRGMISKLNTDELEDQGFNYIMGVKTRQNQVYQYLLHTDKLDWEHSAEHRSLKVLERRVRVKEFLAWKVRNILSCARIEVCDEAFCGVVDQLEELNNKSAPDFRALRQVLRELSEQIDFQLCRKIIDVLKRYKNHYNDESRFIICLNSERQAADREKRKRVIESYKTDLEEIFTASDTRKDNQKLKKKKKKEEKEKGKKNKSVSEQVVEREHAVNKLFEGYKGKYHKFFQIERDETTQQAIGYRLKQAVIDFEHKFDGVFALLTTHDELDAGKIVDSYKNLKEVETFFDDLKHFVDIRPIRHWLEKRVRAHVFICILALLLKRLFEINYLHGKSVTEPLAEIEKVKLVKYKVKFSEREDRYQIIPKVTTISPIQKQYFNKIGLKNPSNLEVFLW